MARIVAIEGGTVVTHDGIHRADVIITDERISGIVADARGMIADERIDASGLYVFPGAIDVHTHFREPEEFTKEGFATGSAGAAAGGVTSVVEMPQADPTTVNAAQFRAKRDQIGRTAIVDMALYGGVVGEPRQDANDLREMAAEGASALKAFMASSSPSFPALKEDQLLEMMKLAAEVNLPFALHAEHDILLQAGLQKMQAAGRKDPLAHAESRPPVVEAAAVAIALYFAELTGAWIHICHCASADALRLIAEARARGVRVTVETCPQYLAVNTDDLVAQKGFARCAPPFRPQSEVDQIWPYVLSESIDLICSDHSAFTAESKQAGDEDIFKAPNGISGIQTWVPVFYEHAVRQRKMDLTQFVRMVSTNPAQIFGLYPRKGTITVGADADIMIFDPNRPWTIKGEDMLHKQKWTPFEGKKVNGRVRRTIRRGVTIYDEMTPGGNNLPGQAGTGRFLPRGYGDRD